jgi:hypothetical protein
MKGFALVAFAAVFAAFLALVGCTTPPPGYRPSISTPWPEAKPGEPALGVPAEMYNYDPNLEYWFTPPYFNPYIGR